MNYIPTTRYLINELNFNTDSKNHQLICEMSEENDRLWLIAVYTTYK